MEQGTSEEGIGAVSTDESDSAEANIEKIREILFGAQAREITARFAELRAALEREVAALHAELKAAVEPIDRYSRHEVEALNTRLGEQERLRVEAMRASEERTGQRLDELRAHLEERARLLQDDLRRKEEALAAATRRAIKELDLRKVDRNALAGLLAQTAVNVGGSEAYPPPSPVERPPEGEDIPRGRPH
jgi:hypothetical protein